jgi:hypothetical protein
MITRKLLGVAALALVAGCSFYGDFAPTTAYPRSARGPAEVELYMEGEAHPTNIRAVGQVRGGLREAFAVGPDSPMRSIELIRETAAASGVDGVYDVRCAPMGTIGAGTCNGTAFVYQ